MRRPDHGRLGDIAAAHTAIHSQLERGGLDDGLVFDAVCKRLIEIGEAVKGLSAEVIGAEPMVPWRDIAGMKDLLTHHYFTTSPAILARTLDHDLGDLAAAATRLLAQDGAQ